MKRKLEAVTAITLVLLLIGAMFGIALLVSAWREPDTHEDEIADLYRRIAEIQAASTPVQSRYPAGDDDRAWLCIEALSAFDSELLGRAFAPVSRPPDRYAAPLPSPAAALIEKYCYD